jgi:hypothetical protein
MSPHKQTLLFPILLITVGIGWLLSTLGYAPDIDWIWTFGLAVIGLLAFALNGINKVTVVIGPFFILASGLSILRQTDRLHFNVELPIFVIVLGILLIIARLPVIPVPKWMTQDHCDDR